MTNILVRVAHQECVRVRVCVCACVPMWVHVGACGCMGACVCAGVRVCADVGVRSFLTKWFYERRKGYL